jgi:hypothetical protein
MKNPSFVTLKTSFKPGKRNSPQGINPQIVEAELFGNKHGVKKGLRKIA